MRARDLAFVALAACYLNPDPRSPSPEQMAKQPFGSWIVVHTSDHLELSGELIAIDATRLYIVENGKTHLHWINKAAVTDADLYKYESGGFTAWGLTGTLSTISHGFLAVFSLPIWLASTAIAGLAESHHVILHYPDVGWDGLSPWARFPQGLPPRLREPPPGPPPPPPAPPLDATPPSG